MKERPILFSGKMVRAILAGRKTETRRVVKPQPACDLPGAYFDAYNGGPQWNWWLPDGRMCNGHDIIKSPYGEPGDMLYVREPCRILRDDEGQIIKRVYEADLAPNASERHWAYRAGRFMPKAWARIRLRLLNVVARRLQDMLPGDAVEEGCPPECYLGDAWKDGLSAMGWFVYAWDSINAKRGYSWASNPWVWRLKFEVAERP